MYNMNVILSTTLVKGGWWCNRAINMNFWKLSCAAGQNSKWGSNMKPWWNFHFQCWYVVFVLLNTGFRSEQFISASFQLGNKRGRGPHGIWTLTEANSATPAWVHVGPHQQLGQTPQNLAELHTPERQHTHRRHRHSCQCCPGGWRCRRRALRGGRAISSPRSCSRCAYRPAPVGLWWWRTGFRCWVSRSCCCTWSFWCSLQEPRDKDTFSANTDVRFLLNGWLWSFH